MKEKYINIEWLEGSIPTIITIPENFNNTLVLMLHAHKAEKNQGGLYTKLANELAKSGYMSARFDFIGCGDNTLPFTRNSIYNMSLCVESVYNYINENYTINKDKTIIIGFSMGARVALHSLDFTKPNKLIFLSPAIENGEYMLNRIFGDNYLDKYDIAKQNGKFEYTDSFNRTITVGPSFFKDIRLSNPQLVIKDYTNDLTIIYPENDSIINPHTQKEFINYAINANNKNVIMIPNADHALETNSSNPNIESLLITNILNEILK